MIETISSVSSAYTIIGVIMGVLGLIGLVAAGWVVARSGMTRSTITTQDTYIKALQQENSFQADTIKRLETRLQAAEAQINVLQEMVTSKAAVDALTQLVRDNQQALLEALHD